MVKGENSVDPTGRFSNRVENYVKFRPGYPDAILSHLESRTGFSRDHIVADIGSGTGIFSRLLLEHGNKVYGVEPNREMRAAAEALLQHSPGFISIDGSAESTQLRSASLDYIFAAQAFHWFDPDRSRMEFQRILRSGGYLVLIWNERKIDSPFSIDYEELIQTFGTDYEKVDHRRIDAKALDTFYTIPPKFAIFDYFQDLDEEGLSGRILSASYMPDRNHPSYLPMIRELKRLFELHQHQGQVRLEYHTKVYYGML